MVCCMQPISLISPPVMKMGCWPKRGKDLEEQMCIYILTPLLLPLSVPLHFLCFLFFPSFVLDNCCCICSISSTSNGPALHQLMPWSATSNASKSLIPLRACTVPLMARHLLLLFTHSLYGNPLEQMPCNMWLESMFYWLLEWSQFLFRQFNKKYEFTFPI